MRRVPVGSPGRTGRRRDATQLCGQLPVGQPCRTDWQRYPSQLQHASGGSAASAAGQWPTTISILASALDDHVGRAGVDGPTAGPLVGARRQDVSADATSSLATLLRRLHQACRALVVRLDDGGRQTEAAINKRESASTVHGPSRESAAQRANVVRTPPTIYETRGSNGAAPPVPRRRVRRAGTGRTRRPPESPQRASTSRPQGRRRLHT